MQFVLSGGGPMIFYNIPMPIWPSFQNKKLEKSGETQETGKKNWSNLLQQPWSVFTA